MLFRFWVFPDCTFLDISSPYLFVSPKTGTMFDPDSFRHTHEKILKAIGSVISQTM